MHFLVKATIPVQAGNVLVRDPNFGKLLEEVLSDIKPKSAYFAVEGGQRTMYFVVDISDASGLPAVSEPLWLAFEASVECIPVMTESDFQKAAPHIDRAVKKY